MLGAPPLHDQSAKPGKTLPRQSPSTVEIAIEVKSVMTEHRKNVKNRKRDLEAHHEHVHNYSERAIAGAVLVINAAPSFKSPLRQTPSIHKNPADSVVHCVNELRSVAVRGPRSNYGLDACCAIVVDVDNVNPEAFSFVTKPPAPVVGDQLHYDAFVQSLCSAYAERFGSS